MTEFDPSLTEEKIRIQMSLNDFIYYYQWASDHREDSDEFRNFWILLERKLDAMIDREYYQMYLHSPDPETRAEYRIKYLERRGISPDWRW